MTVPEPPPSVPFDEPLKAILDPSAEVVYFPVRHHSPTCARLLRALILRLRPAAVLIEGPADFNDRLQELALPHRLPLAIYSFVRLPDGRRLGAYYPFCVYSPEWQALHAAWEVGAATRFIDLPWADIATAQEEPSNRYADAELRRGRYVSSLCRRLAVDDFNSLWDTLFELDTGLTVERFLERFHHFCLHVRLLEEQVRSTDRRREAFMAAEVRAARARHTGPLLVVTGGYHSSALWARVAGFPLAGTEDPVDCQPSLPAKDEERGIALTPYSYERLDSLRGYEAGMPNPGFYHQVWLDWEKGQPLQHQRLLARVAGLLRQRGQPVSAADLIAAETSAGALAALRGHAEVWRQDLVDGITTALVKEDLGPDHRHPLLDAVHEVLRGGERGRLAAGAALPALVQDMNRQLAEHHLEAELAAREVDLDLTIVEDRVRSRLLHRLRLLQVAGYERLGGTDLVSREDLSRVWERWRLQWSPDLESSAIEAARYGPSLADAVTARLEERVAGVQGNAEAAALLLLDAALAGLDVLAGRLASPLHALVRQDANFFRVAAALRHLLYLYRYDQVLGTADRADLGVLLTEVFGRCLWLLETLGQTSGRDRELLDGLQTLLEVFERCGSRLPLHRHEFVDVLRRVLTDRAQGAVARGAAVGALWTLGEADAEQVRAELRFFADPERLGDFLAGLFALAREAAQRQADLVLTIDALLAGYSGDDFLAALPALRLAFTYFTPREKHHLALTLVNALGLEREQPLAALEVSPETAARALAFEECLFAAVERYGLRGKAT